MRQGYMLVSEAAAQLHMTTAGVRLARQRGDLKGEKIGGVWLIRRADVDAYVKAPGGPGRPRQRKPGPKSPLTTEQRVNAATAQRQRRERERQMKNV